MSNELTALTDFTRNLFEHAYLVLPWFCVNSGRSEYKVDQYNKALSVVKLLKKNNFRVLFNRKVPSNDGGISLGQAAIAANLMKH